MNKDKVIKDLKERNDKLQSQYMQEQARNYHLHYVIDKAVEYIKHSWWLRLDQVYDTSKDLKGWEVEELLDILKGGNDE